MSLPKLSPLQARFAASFAATLFIIIVYFVVFGPRLAYAIDVDSIAQRDHNHPIPFDLEVPQDLEGWEGVDAAGGTLVEHKTTGLDGGISARVPASADGELSNNEPRKKNIEMGETQHWVFSKEALAGPKASTTSDTPLAARSESRSDDGNEFEDILHESKRDDTTLSPRANTVYITANTCSQPLLNATQVSTDTSPAQLRIYISQSEEINTPGPNTDDADITVIDFDGGYVRVELEADGDVYVGIEAPNSTRYSGIYNYEIAASVDDAFHSVDSNTPHLFFVDSDSSAALLQSNRTTGVGPGGDAYKQWMEMDPPPYTMFAHSMNDSSILGLHQSYCGLSLNARIKKESSNIEGGMTNRGVDRNPKQQFYIKNLNQSSSYYGFLALEGNSIDPLEGVLGSGRRLWRAMNFTTKAENNCAVLYDLEFCSEVAYAVPSNPDLNAADLTRIYDKHAENLYQNFTRSLQQIPCNTSDSSQYSLARTCTQCAAAYKQWLCAVTIPRCQDFSSSLPFLQTRNTGQAFLNGTMLSEEYPGRQAVLSNTSRNPLVDTEIKPGPYKEVLPCQDLCHELVQSCPAALGFGCPSNEWLNSSYGTRSRNGDITCSYLGAAYFMNAGQSLGGLHMLSSVLTVLAAFWGVVWGLDP